MEDENATRACAAVNIQYMKSANHPQQNETNGGCLCDAGLFNVAEEEAGRQGSNSPWAWFLDSPTLKRPESHKHPPLGQFCHVAAQARVAFSSSIAVNGF